MAYRASVDKADVTSFASLTAGPMGASLRKLAPALQKAQTASDALSKALSEKPALGLLNPLADEFNPLKGYQLELIEMTPGKEEHLARVRIGLPGRLKEETLSVKKEDATFRVSLPSVFLKSVRLMTPDRVAKQVDSLNRLADIMTSLAQQVTKGELTTKEAVVLKLSQAIKDVKLGEVK